MKTVKEKKRAARLLLNIALYYLHIKLTFNIFHFSCGISETGAGTFPALFPERLAELLKQTANIHLEAEQKEFASLNCQNLYRFYSPWSPPDGQM